MGFALGVLHLSLDDFCALSPKEFGETCKAYHEEGEREIQLQYEVARWHASIVVSPHCKGKPKIPLPWDRPKRPLTDTPQVSKEEGRQRFLETMSKLNK